MTRPLVPILLIVAPDFVAARQVARRHGLASDQGIAEAVRTVTRASALACWHDVPVLFFDLAFWPANAGAQQLSNDLAAAIQSGRLRLPRDGEVEAVADEFRERCAAIRKAHVERSEAQDLADGKRPVRWRDWKTDMGRA